MLLSSRGVCISIPRVQLNRSRRMWPWENASAYPGHPRLQSDIRAAVNSCLYKQSSLGRSHFQFLRRLSGRSYQDPEARSEYILSNKVSIAAVLFGAAEVISMRR